MPGFGSIGRNGTMSTQFDERRRLAFIHVDLDSSLARFPEAVAKAIAKERRRMPRNIQDFKVFHGGRKSAPYNDEIMVILEINEEFRDTRDFPKLIQMVGKVLNGTFQTVDFPQDPIRDPYNILHDSGYQGWALVQ